MGDVALEVVERLNALDVRSYLLARGWKRANSKIPDIGIFRRPEAEDVEVLIPFSSVYADFREGMVRAIVEIARYEHRPASQIVQDLLRPRVDLLRFALESNESADGAIKLDDGLALLSGSRKALLAAACSVKRPQSFHARMSLREAEAFVGKCRLGQTERGSFVATVECALDIGEASPTDSATDSVEPFGRKVTTLLLSSIERIVASIQADDMTSLVSPSPNDVVVSANLCDAIAEMLPSSEDAVLRIGSSWSPTLPAPRNIPTQIRIERQYVQALTRIARELRPGKNPAPDMFVGKIDALLGQPSSDGRMTGEIVLAAQVEEQVLKLRFDLDANEYSAACDAHRDGRYVSVRGILRMGARVHRLETATAFRVVEG